jgi:hypothetical protein
MRVNMDYIDYMWIKLGVVFIAYFIAGSCGWLRKK